VWQSRPVAQRRLKKNVAAVYDRRKLQGGEADVIKSRIVATILSGLTVTAQQGRWSGEQEDFAIRSAFQFPTVIDRRYIFFQALLRSGTAQLLLTKTVGRGGLAAPKLERWRNGDIRPWIGRRSPHSMTASADRAGPALPGF